MTTLVGIAVLNSILHYIHSILSTGATGNQRGSPMCRLALVYHSAAPMPHPTISGIEIGLGPGPGPSPGAVELSALSYRIILTGDKAERALEFGEGCGPNRIPAIRIDIVRCGERGSIESEPYHVVTLLYTSPLALAGSLNGNCYCAF